MQSVFFIFLVSITTLSSQLVLKKGVMEIAVKEYNLSFFSKVFASPYILLGISLQVIGFVLWIMVISRENLGYAFGLSGAFFYIMLPLITFWLYGEKLLPMHWVGLVLISSGVLCMLAKG